VQRDPGVAGQPDPYVRVGVGAVVVAHDVQWHARVGAGDLAQKFSELLVAVAGVAGVGDLAGGDLQGGEQRGGAAPEVIVAALFGHPGRSGSTGAARSSAWVWGFSSTHSTTASSGGLRCRPTTSRTLASSCGSVENLQPSVLGARAYWVAGRYHLDFRREDGRWRIRHLQVQGIFEAPHDQGWAHAEFFQRQTAPARDHPPGLADPMVTPP